MFDSKGNFCVGEVYIDSTFDITVADYEVALPEIHSFGPMISPQPIRVSVIINWIERGLHVEFQKRSDEEAVLFFVMEYNKYAKYVNDADGKVTYKLAVASERWLKMDLNWNNETRAQDKPISRQDNPFVKRVHSNSGVMMAKPKVYNNESVRAKFSKTKNKKITDVLMKQSFKHDYDIFANSPQDPDIPGMNSIMSDPELVLDF